MFLNALKYCIWSILLVVLLTGCLPSDNPTESNITEPPNPNEMNAEGTVTDIDGNIDNTIKIGNQVWTVENLRVTKYTDGTPIPQIQDNNEWSNSDTGAYCYYGTPVTVINKNYGVLYNWYTINTGKLTPKGWHIPTYSDWEKLEEYLVANGYCWDGTTDDNKIAMSLAGQTGWKYYECDGCVGNDTTNNNSTGYSAFPAGYRDSDGNYDFNRQYATWWSSTESASVTSAFYYSINYSRPYPYCHPFDKNHGLSVRLIRD